MSIDAMKQALDALEHEAQKGNDDAYRVERDALRAAIEQPRQWQGLTDEEIAEVRHLYDGTAGWTIERFARAVEAKLKEKNK